MIPLDCITAWRTHVELKLLSSSWLEQIINMQPLLDPLHRGDQTLMRLIDGFIAQLNVYRDTGIQVENIA